MTQVFVLLIDGYVIGAYTTKAKAKSAWRKYVAKSRKDNPQYWPKGVDIFNHVKISEPLTVDGAVSW